jgi:uncharacterized protein (UPF0261 family)
MRGVKSILIIATLDTKGAETSYLREKITELGRRPIVLDISMRPGKEGGAEIPPEEVAKAGGSTLQEIYKSKDRAASTAIMTRGATEIAKKLAEEGEIHGIIGIGGSTGSLVATDVMRALPFGLPKLMVSSTAALPGLSTRYIGTGDIMLMHSVAEISGVNDILRNVLDRAAYAMSGMVEATPVQELRRGSKGKLIAMTMLGPCEKCATNVRLALEERGCQIIGFSAAGIGDQAMEEMVEQGLFDGVVDLAPGGVIDHIIGGTRDAGPHRLESAGKRGIPQVVSTCGLNHITPRKSEYTDDHKRRRKYDLDRFRTWLRASPEELTKAAQAFVQKLNRAKGPVKIIIPLKGWSSVDQPESETYDPEEDMIFVNELRKGLKPEIEVRTVESNMEELAFSKALVEACEEVFDL